MNNDIIKKHAIALSSNDCSVLRRSDIECPSTQQLEEFVHLVAQIVFPGYYANIAPEECLTSNIEHNLERIYSILSMQIDKARALRNIPSDLAASQSLAMEFISSICGIRSSLNGDLEAIRRADPSAKSDAEIIFCYPSITAIMHYRIAHRLHTLGVPILSRMIAEIAHSRCGIDIHPAAQIGENFAIDHGTGIVIGATSIIGNNVLIYQGVTLGAKRFQYDKTGYAIDQARHPIIEDNVIIYSNATILGRITIGHDTIIGANMWVDCDVKPNSKITPSSPWITI